MTSIEAASTPALVRALYEAYQERTWDLASSYLHPEAVVDMPHTSERLEGRNAVIDFQRSYPEPWGTLLVVRVVGDDDAAAAEINLLEAGTVRHTMAAFWRRQDGLLHEGVELWVTVGAEEPPIQRAASPATVAARRAGRAGATPPAGPDDLSRPQEPS